MLRVGTETTFLPEIGYYQQRTTSTKGNDKFRVMINSTRTAIGHGENFSITEFFYTCIY